jgi:hypothetical protein
MRTFLVPPGTGAFLSEIGEDDDEQRSRCGCSFRRIKGREPRTQSIATRFTRSEERALQKRAEADGQNLREWARDVLLCVVVNDTHAEMEMHIFTEIVGIQMLLMSVLDPLQRGEKMAPEELAALRRVQTTKAA